MADPNLPRTNLQKDQTEEADRCQPLL